MLNARLIVAGALGLAVSCATAAFAAPSYLLILGGGSDTASAEKERDQLSTAAFKDRLRLSTGYPRVEVSAQVAGLNPGFFVATLGSCADREQALTFLRTLKQLIGPAGTTKPYLRPIADGRAESCPTIVAPPPLCPDVTECAKLCAADNAAGCYQQARLIVRSGRGEFRPIVEKACTLNHGEGCEWMSHAADTKVAAVRFLERSCQLGTLSACEELGTKLLAGRDMEINPARGTELLEKTCKLGGSGACRALGELYLDNPDPKLSKRGRKLLGDLCRSGDYPDACRKIGDLKAACDSGDINACCERNPRSRVCDV